MPKALAIQINWQFTGSAGIMQVEHTANCFGGAWFKSPLSTKVWHPRHIWRETAFQFAEVLALNGETYVVSVNVFNTNNTNLMSVANVSVHASMPKDDIFCATDPLCNWWDFVPSLTRPSSDTASVHRRHELDVIDDTLSQASPDLRQTQLQFIDVMNLLSVTNVSVHASMPKAIILAFNVTQEHKQLSLCG